MPKIKKMSSSNILWPRHQTCTAVPRLNSQIKGSSQNKPPYFSQAVSKEWAVFRSLCLDHATGWHNYGHQIRFLPWIIFFFSGYISTQKARSSENDSLKISCCKTEKWDLCNTETFVTSENNSARVIRAWKDTWIHALALDKVDLNPSLLAQGNPESFRWEEEKKM